MLVKYAGRTNAPCHYTANAALPGGESFKKAITMKLKSSLTALITLAGFAANAQTVTLDYYFNHEVHKETLSSCLFQ